MALPRNECIVRTTYLGYLFFREEDLGRGNLQQLEVPLAHISAPVHEARLEHLRRGQHPGCLAQYHRKPL